MRFAFAAAVVALSAAPTLAQDLVFTLVNDSSYSIVEMYVGPTGDPEWGENILMVDSVEPGTEGEVTIADGLEVCDYDLRFVTAEGATAEKQQNLCDINIFTVSD